MISTAARIVVVESWARLLRILLVQDDMAQACRIIRHLASEEPEWSIIHDDTVSNAVVRLRCDAFDVILLDLVFAGVEHLDGLKWLHATSPAIPIVIMSQSNDDTLALAGVSIGAHARALIHI